MPAYKINFISASTVIDSIKISRAVTYAYSLLYPDKIDNFIYGIKNGEISFSDVFPIKNNCLLYPTPPINNYISHLDNEEKNKYIKNRKKILKFVDYKLLKEIMKNFIENNFNGVEYYKIFENIKEEINFIMPITEPGIQFLEKPIMYNGKYKYNEIFTKELYLYNEGYFIVENPDKFVKAAIMLLNDMGLSGRRNSGKGTVSITELKEDLQTGFKAPGFYILLSSYIPDEESLKNIDFSKSRYNVGIFQGKDIHGTPIGPFRYLKSGSILYIKDKIKGEVYSEHGGIMVFNPIIKEVQYEGKN